MKKIFVLLLACILAFSLSGCIYEEFSIFYTEVDDVDGFKIGINRLANCCFAGYYDCTEYTENMEITIPDEYNGIPITRIGGYAGPSGPPYSFDIFVGDIYWNAPEGSKYHHSAWGSSYMDDDYIPEEFNIENVVFKLNIGKNIEVIETVDMDYYYPHINEDGSITFYHPVVYIECSEENKYFYSDNGKLYSKRTHSLISDFAYLD